MISVITKPMRHQEDALAKLLPIKWGAAFMDMGTGKSLTAIIMAASRQARGKIDHVIWFTPVSLMDNVRRQIKEHTGTDEQVHVFSANTNELTVPGCFWYVVGLESMGSSNRTVLTVHKLITERAMIIIDESDKIKEHRAKRTKRLTLLARLARYRLIMTGTPISQGIVDLYAQMSFLSPKILGYNSFYSFAANHLEYSDKYRGMIVKSHNTEELANKIKPYVYQVTKDQCLDLPDKQYINRICFLTDEQKQAYELTKEFYLEMADMMVHSDSEWEKTLWLFRLFASLQQIASGYINEYGKKRYFEHKRLELLQQVISEIADDESIIIWCKYLHDIQAISQALAEDWGQYQVCEYHGSLSTQERNANESRFHAGAKFFLATPSTGGHGLTLVESSYVIFYNSSFKYSERIQAEDRAHRIGQTRKVTYISLWVDCGIEDRIYRALARKKDAREEFRDEVELIKEQAENRKNILKTLIKSL